MAGTCRISMTWFFSLSLAKDFFLPFKSLVYSYKNKIHVSLLLFSEAPPVHSYNGRKDLSLLTFIDNPLLKILEDMARFAGQFLAPVEGFGQEQYFFMLFWPILRHIFTNSAIWAELV